METGQETDIIELNVPYSQIKAPWHTIMSQKYYIHKEAYSVQQTMTVAHPLKNVVQL